LRELYVLGAKLPGTPSFAWPSIAVFAVALIDGGIVEDHVEVDEDAVERPVAPFLR
jgi:hypothetical protein